MRIYLSGPMNHVSEYTAFHEAAAKLRALGCEVKSPAENDLAMGYDGGTLPEGGDRAKLFRWDVEAVLWADAVVTLPNWRTSAGANLEVSIAHVIGTPVVEYADAAGRGSMYQTGSTESENRYAGVMMAAQATPSQRLHFIDPKAGRVIGAHKVWLA